MKIISWLILSVAVAYVVCHIANLFFVWIFSKDSTNYLFKDDSPIYIFMAIGTINLFFYLTNRFVPSDIITAVGMIVGYFLYRERMKIRIDIDMAMQKQHEHKNS